MLDYTRGVPNKERLKHDYCDVPMATKKHMFPCNKQCETCFCYIKVSKGAFPEHVNTEALRK